MPNYRQPSIGLSSSIGDEGVFTTNCRYDYALGSSSPVSLNMTVVHNPDGSFGSASTSGTGGAAASALRNYTRDNFNSNEPCPSYVQDGIHSFNRRSSETTNSETGVYEWGTVVDYVGSLAIILIILMVGVTVVKKAINAVTEETSEEDDVEWYEGADGKEYWRIKRKRFGGY